MGWSCSDHYTVLDAAARFKPLMVINLEAAQIGGSPRTRSLQSQGNLTLKLTYLRAFLA